MNTVALLMIVLLASHVNSSPIVNFSWDTPRHFCGSQLANVLALICNKEGYNFYPVNADATTVRSRRRKRVPIVEECCYNTCTPHHLRAYCWGNGSNIRSVLDSPVTISLVDKLAIPQKDPNKLTPRRDVDNDLLVEITTAVPKSNNIIPNRQNYPKQTQKKEPMIIQDQTPGRVKTVTPYFDKMPSVIITKTQH